MNITKADRNNTFFASPLSEAYYGGELGHIYPLRPDLSGIEQAITKRSEFPQERRDILVASLRAQYAGAGIELRTDSLVYRNIEALQDSNTFTITTGQQIHIALGPLYVLYKILDTLQICDELNQVHTDKRFVPVFWMASEDHDLEEIADVELFGRTFTWETDQRGAVGRMNAKGVSELIRSMRSEFRLDETMGRFADAVESAYSSGDLAQGFRRLLHGMMEDEGLVIIDGDDKALKQCASQLWIDELHHRNNEALLKGTEAMTEAGFDQQLLIRACNLFFLNDRGRVRIENTASSIRTIEGFELGSANEVESIVARYAHDLSPNAALRPVYQEYILPNVVYVGGGAELKYWGQLTPVFERYDLIMPVVHLRTSMIIVPSKALKNNEIEDVRDYFSSEEELVSRHSQVLNDKIERASAHHQRLYDEIDAFKELLEVDNEGYSYEKKVEKIKARFDDLLAEHLNRIRLKEEDDVQLNKILKIKRKYFDKGSIQERSTHFWGFAGVFDSQSATLRANFGLKSANKVNIWIN